MDRDGSLLDGARQWLAWTGMETDLIFSKNWPLPGFAAFPLVESDAGRARVAAYYDELLALGREAGVGVILDTVTWMANADRARPLGYDAAALVGTNAAAVALARAAAGRADGVPVLVSGQVGPRGDAYKAGVAGADAAAAYHAPQIEALATAGVDVITAYTLGSAAEAIGIVRASVAAGVPCVISFTVETDGRLADGATLGDAIGAVEAATAGAAVGYGINCAHPTHFGPILGDAPWTRRLIGLVANASRKSHAELDASATLDDGDPHEFGEDMGRFRARFPQLRVFGGCCGTDTRHLSRTAFAVAQPR